MAVSETIVREYFELHGFLVRQLRKFIPRGRREEGDIDFLVLNPHALPGAKEVPFVLESGNLPQIFRAIVAVKGWHSEVFDAGTVAHAPRIFRFVQPKVFQRAVREFGNATPLAKILVVPALPQSHEARRRSIEFLRSKGIDAVIPFRTMLADLIDRIEINRNYQKSDLLQTLRILKNYDFFRGPQLELFKPKRRKARSETRSSKSEANPNTE